MDFQKIRGVNLLAIVYTGGSEAERKEIECGCFLPQKCRSLVNPTQYLET